MSRFTQRNWHALFWGVFLTPPLSREGVGGFFGDTYQNVGMDLRFHMVYKEFSPDPLKIPKIPFWQKCPDLGLTTIPTVFFQCLLLMNWEFRNWHRSSPDYKSNGKGGIVAVKILLNPWYFWTRKIYLLPLKSQNKRTTNLLQLRGNTVVIIYSRYAAFFPIE